MTNLVFFIRLGILLSIFTLSACGGGGGGGGSPTPEPTTPAVADTTPDAFVFVAQTDVATNITITSDNILISGINTSTGISISGGEYAINSGDFSSAAATVNDGDTVQVRLTSSSEFETPTTATLTAGGVSGEFNVTTRAEVEDTTPENFSFDAQNDLEPEAQVTSNTITIEGINTATAISIEGGEYAINGGEFTASPGLVNLNDTIELRVVASSEFDTTATSTATIGDLTASFAVSTRAFLAYITTWKTDNEGVGKDNQITINTNPDFDYDFTIDWGDENVDENVTSDITHSYETPGIYTVTITGDYPAPFVLGVAEFEENGINLTDNLKLLSVEQWGDQTWQSMRQAFFLASNLQINDTNAPDLSSVTDLSSMFNFAIEFNSDIGHWDVSNVTNMSNMFNSTGAFNQDIGDWIVSSVVDMSGMFNGAEAFNQDIGGWDVSAVSDMSEMFRSADVFDQDIGNWNVGAVTDMSNMFNGADVFNQDIGDWNVSAVNNMFAMFTFANAFNQDIGNWDVGAVTDMSLMFRFNDAFNQDIGDWNVSAVTDMSFMFNGADAFNQDIGSWDVSSVSDMSVMFNRAETFDQDISSWNVGAVTDMAFMFSNSVISTANYDALLIGWSALSLRSNVRLDVNSNYTEASEAARQNIIDTFTWTINDLGLELAAEAAAKLVAPVDAFQIFTNVAVNIDIEGTGGATASCEAPLLPEGLSIQASGSGCVISGAPTTSFAATSIDVTGTNPQGADTVSISLEAVAQTAYITMWKTDNEGASEDTEVTLTLNPDLDYNFTVNWGDDNVDINVTADITHTYASAGTYEVTITGTYPAPYFPETTNTANTDSLKLVSVDQWGNVPFSSMKRAFYNADNVVFNDLLAPVFQSEISMEKMFELNDNFNSDISFWDVSNVIRMDRMFNGASTFNQDLDDWNVSSVTTMTAMFRNAIAFNQDLNSWQLDSLTSMASMFQGASSFNGQVSNWETGGVTANGLASMFQGASAFDQDIGGWDVSKVTSMNNTFNDASSFNQNLSLWTTSAVTNMAGIFDGASAFNGDISSWDVSKVTSMSSMFSGASSFNQDLNLWITSAVESMDNMFRSAQAFNGDISDWDVSAVTNMLNMFFNADNFNQFIGDWNVEAVTNMSQMFENNLIFNQDISNWQVTSVTNMAEMFRETRAFNQDISGWNVSSVENMGRMFFSASAFDQDLGGWDVSNATNLFLMLQAAALSTANYDALLIGWSQLPSLPFDQSFSVSNSNYSVAAEAARQSIIDDYIWTIDDLGLLVPE